MSRYKTYDEIVVFHAYKHLKKDGSGLIASACIYDERGEELSGALLAAIANLAPTEGGE